MRRAAAAERCGHPAVSAGHDDSPAAGSGGQPGPGAPLAPTRVDGKTVRGAKNADGRQVHLLAALAGEQGLVAAQTKVGAKTNEIPMIIPLLDDLDLAGAVITADALHCQRATAEYLHKRCADFVRPAKDSQPGLSGALDALPWPDVPVAHAATDRGHGRITTRTIQVLPAPDNLPFPHVSQACLIERHVTGLDGKPLSDAAALGVTSLARTRTRTRAGPEAIAGLVRGQCRIESLHWLRDTLYREDNSTVRTRSGQGPWPRSGISRSEPCAWPDATTPPKPPAGPAATWTGPSPSSDSHHDLETAVAPAPGDARHWRIEGIARTHIYAIFRMRSSDLKRGCIPDRSASGSRNISG
jgi:predicted transposase YbfD/YdcC